jgi:hypothetical protein
MNGYKSYLYTLYYFASYSLLFGAGVAQSVQWVGYWLDDQGSIPGKGSSEIFSLRHRVQTGSGAHPASYWMSTGCSYPWGKAARSWS